MKKNSWLGMCSLSGKCQISQTIPCKIHMITQKISDNIIGAADHQIYCPFIILIMSCPHGIFKIIFIVIFAAQHTDSALCQEWIWLVCLLLGDKQDFRFLRKVQRTVQSGCPCSHNNDIIMFFHLSFLTSCLIFVCLCNYTPRIYRCQDTCI